MAIPHFYPFDILLDLMMSAEGLGRLGVCEQRRFAYWIFVFVVV
jgi:hypothetical protein